ncbi:hypothetical protein BCR39DRAFT_518122 [Naematelia encephala]|uniref:Uncharacterized protein n=1 Tax=Naematelia encephala TaxID=71784 RepID=A0A1Y2BGS2_9TREE|nr:hypothetical protein BCR39DRAFT_518122 [Naematelia encephala]
MQPSLLRKVRVPICYYTSTRSNFGLDSTSVISPETKAALSCNAREAVIYSMEDIRYLVRSRTVLPNVDVIHLTDKFKRQTQYRIALVCP